MASLPPGQRESKVFHRFGLTPLAKRVPRDSGVATVRLCGEVANEIEIQDPLNGLDRVSQTSDFHCVTTWSARGLRWEGVRFRDFYEQVVVRKVVPNESATLVALRGQDGARTGMRLDDLLDPSVVLADRLNGAPLAIDHGAPLRLVAPNHYGYKSVKHLCELKFLFPDAGYRATGFQLMDHPRARVVLEERGRVVPGWLLRYMYRPLIKRTARKFAQASEEREQRVS